MLRSSVGRREAPRGLLRTRAPTPTDVSAEPQASFRILATFAYANAALISIGGVIAARAHPETRARLPRRHWATDGAKAQDPSSCKALPCDQTPSPRRTRVRSHNGLRPHAARPGERRAAARSCAARQRAHQTFAPRGRSLAASAPRPRPAPRGPPCALAGGSIGLHGAGDVLRVAVSLPQGAHAAAAPAAALAHGKGDSRAAGGPRRAERHQRAPGAPPARQRIRS